MVTRFCLYSTRSLLSSARGVSYVGLTWDKTYENSGKCRDKSRKTSKVFGVMNDKILIRRKVI